MPLSKEDLTSVQGDVQSVYIDAAAAIGDVASHTFNTLANRPKEIKVEVDDAALKNWSKYSQGIEGHPIKVSVEASRRALRGGESKENIAQMLTADPYAQGLARERGVKNAQSYVEIVIANASYKEALAKSPKKERQQEPAHSRSR